MQARGGPFEPQEAADLMRQLLAGLAAAHAGEIVHRDIKPSNLFLCAPDDAGARRLKILDFGIAKVLRHRGEDRGPAPLALPTAEGITIGTPRFLAPEQALGRPVDGRTDLYSAGAVLYWMLTGKDPFHDAVGEFAIIRAHATRRPAAPSTLAKGSVPAALDQAVLKALAKDPVDRYATAAEFSAAIAASLATRPAPRDWASTEPVDTAAIRAKPALPFTARAAPAAAPPPVIPREVLRAAFREHGTGADQDGDPTRVLPAVAPAPSGAGEVAREDGPAPAAPSRFRPRLRGALTVILVAMGLAVLLGLAFRGAWPVR
jgi:serine/threonine-protein kinase